MTPSLQQEAFFSSLLSTSSSITLEALAGTGKTTTLTFGVSRLNPPHAIACAFNKKNAQDLAERMPSQVISKTLNSLGLGALKSTIGRFPSINPYKTLDLIKAQKARGFCPDLSRLIAGAKAFGYLPRASPMLREGLVPPGRASLEEIAQHFDLDLTTEKDGDDDPFEIAEAVLQASLRSAFGGKFEADFDDMLWIPTLYGGAFQTSPLVLVDEAQDLSPIQHAQLRCLVQPGGRLVAVGDRHQAIYGFRGADASSLQVITEGWGSTVLPLSVSFRCPQAVIEEAQRWVPEIETFAGAPRGRVERKSSWDLHSLPSGSAVVCRVKAPIISLAFALIRAGVPAKVLGRDIGENLIRFVGRFKTEDLPSLRLMIEAHRERERSVLLGKRKYQQAENLEDKVECIEVIAEGLAPSATTVDLRSAILAIFDETRPAITLSTIHKAKGLEWPSVFFLDSERIPLPFCRDGWALQQEYNLAYVATTRAQDTLTFISSKDRRGARPEGGTRNGKETTNVLSY